MKPPHDPRRDPPVPAAYVPRPTPNPQFEQYEHPSYNHNLEASRGSSGELPQSEVLEHVRELGYRQGASEVKQLRDDFKEHQKAEDDWRREVDRKLNRAVDGIERMEQNHLQSREDAKGEWTEVKTLVFRHEEFVQQAKGAAFAGKFVWVLIGGLVSAILWLFTHTTSTPSASAKTSEPSYPHFSAYEVVAGAPTPGMAAPSSSKPVVSPPLK